MRLSLMTAMRRFVTLLLGLCLPTFALVAVPDTADHALLERLATRGFSVHEDDLDEAKMAAWIRQAAVLPGWGKA